MGDRYRQQRNDRSGQDRDYSSRSRQQEQFYSDRDSQFGEGGSFGGGGDYRNEGFRNNSGDEPWGGGSGYSERERFSGGSSYGSSSGGDWRNRDRGGSSSGDREAFGGSSQNRSNPSGYSQTYDYNAPRETHSTFRGDDYGGGAVYGASSTGGGGYSGGGGYAPSPGFAGMERDRSGSSGGGDRGFLARAGDEIASWFGDEEAERRRDQDHRGRGPSNYTRSDDRILEDACDRLTDDSYVDASNITVSVENGEVTLNGTVNSRQEKRRAEDCIESLSGIGHVQNNLRVSNSSQGQTGTSSSTSGTSGTLA